MREVRVLPILNSAGEYVDDAALIMAGAMHYPNCTRSIFHYRDVKGRDEELVPGKYSQIGQLISMDTIGRKRQGHIAGYLALRLIEMSEAKLDPSIGKAEYLTVEYAKTSTIDGQEFKPKTLEGVRKAFNRFKPVCHLWAAQVAFLDLFIECGKSLEAFAKILSAASVFEDRLRAIEKPSGWNPWAIPDQFRGKFDVKIPPLNESARYLLEQYAPVPR